MFRHTTNECSPVFQPKHHRNTTCGVTKHQKWSFKWNWLVETPSSVRCRVQYPNVEFGDTTTAKLHTKHHIWGFDVLIIRLSLNTKHHIWSFGGVNIVVRSKHHIVNQITKSGVWHNNRLKLDSCNAKCEIHTFVSGCVAQQYCLRRTSNAETKYIRSLPAGAAAAQRAAGCAGNLPAVLHLPPSAVCRCRGSALGSAMAAAAPAASQCAHFVVPPHHHHPHPHHHHHHNHPHSLIMFDGPLYCV